MKLTDIIELLDAAVLTKHDIKFIDVTRCISSDMMSDVLAFVDDPGALLITGLTNSQSVRTADIADAAAILYIRGKKPDKDTLALAAEMNIPVLSTKKGMFEVSGILHAAGLAGIC